MRWEDKMKEVVIRKALREDIERIEEIYEEFLIQIYLEFQQKFLLNLIMLKLNQLMLEEIMKRGKKWKKYFLKNWKMLTEKFLFLLFLFKEHKKFCL